MKLKLQLASYRKLKKIVDRDSELLKLLQICQLLDKLKQTKIKDCFKRLLLFIVYMLIVCSLLKKINVIVTVKKSLFFILKKNGTLVLNDKNKNKNGSTFYSNYNKVNNQMEVS